MHLSGQLQGCHINEESLELEGSSKNDRSLKTWRVVDMDAKSNNNFNAVMHLFHNETNV